MRALQSAEPLVEVEGLTVAYQQEGKRQRVLQNVSFRITRGEVLGLVGESGCGKSTAAHLLLGYRTANSRIESGRIMFGGMDLLQLPRTKLDDLRGNKIAFVPQNPTTALSPHMRVGQHIYETYAFHRPVVARLEAERRVATVLEMVGLMGGDILERFPHQLSGGQQQRVVIAMALVCDPELLVLDEPTTGLDVTTQRQIVNLLIELRRNIGMSMLFVTHDLALLSEIADRVGVMYAGHIVEIAPTDDLYRHARHPYSRGLIASVPGLDNRQGSERLRGFLRRGELPPGCPFAPRCPHVDSICVSQVQSVEPVTEDGRHRVACRRWAQIPATGAARSTSRPASTTIGGSARRPLPLLSLRDVDITYARSRWNRFHQNEHPGATVREISFDISPGEILSLVGESGSGKSTIARAISGLIPPASGDIRFEGQHLAPYVHARPQELLRKIQYVFQNPDASLNPRRRVGSIIERPVRVFLRKDPDQITTEVQGALANVNLGPDYHSRFPDQLSGGERQRVAIARALVCSPTLLLCDEILSSLDVSIQASILDLLRTLRRNHDIAILFISHDLSVVREISNRVAVLFGGSLFEIGAADKVFAPPFHPYTFELLSAAPGEKKTARTVQPKVSIGNVRPALGCAYASRCRLKIDTICSREPPPWRQAGPDLHIRCHRALSELEEAP